MGSKKDGPKKGHSKKGKTEHTSVPAKKALKNPEGSKNNKIGGSKREEKKNKVVTIVSKQIILPQNSRENKHSPRKGGTHNRGESLTKKQHGKSHDKGKGEEINKKAKNVEADKSQSGGCFLCCCCGENADLQTELVVEDNKKEEEEAALKKKLELEAKKKAEEEAQRKREAEEREKEAQRIREEEETRTRMEEEETKLSDYNDKAEDKTIQDEVNEEEVPKKAVLKKIGIKAKQPPKKARLNFIGAAAAPPAPLASACVGDPPKTKSTHVKLGEGVYLIYDSKINNGQLKMCYSKTPINKSGVLAYINSNSIPPFYFEQNKGENIIVNNVSNTLQSTFINDRKPYYQGWVEFIRKTKQFNGVLYLLPAADLEPPPKMDIVFLDSKEKKIHQPTIEKPVDLHGDYVLVIHHGLDIFKKEINVTDILSYIGSYGAYSEL